jgi:hypothetical protein
MINKTIAEVDEQLTSDPTDQKNEEDNGQAQASSSKSSPLIHENTGISHIFIRMHLR